MLGVKKALKIGYDIYDINFNLKGTAKIDRYG